MTGWVQVPIEHSLTFKRHQKKKNTIFGQNGLLILWRRKLLKLVEYKGPLYSVLDSFTQNNNNNNLVSLDTGLEYKPPVNIFANIDNNRQPENQDNNLLNNRINAQNIDINIHTVPPATPVNQVLNFNLPNQASVNNKKEDDFAKLFNTAQKEEREAFLTLPNANTAKDKAVKDHSDRFKKQAIARLFKQTIKQAIKSGIDIDYSYLKGILRLSSYSLDQIKNIFINGFVLEMLAGHINDQVRLQNLVKQKEKTINEKIEGGFKRRFKNHNNTDGRILFTNTGAMLNFEQLNIHQIRIIENLKAKVEAAIGSHPMAEIRASKLMRNFFRGRDL